MSERDRPVIQRHAFVFGSRGPKKMDFCGVCEESRPDCIRKYAPPKMWGCCEHCAGACVGVEMNGHFTPCIDGCNDGRDRFAEEQARRLRNPQDHLVAPDAHLDDVGE